MMSTLNAPMQSPLQPQLQMQMQQQMPQNMMPPGMMMPGQQVPGQSGPMMALPPGTPGAETGRIVPPGELKGFARAKAEWQAMPPIRKVIVGTFPGVCLLVYFMLFDEEPQQQAKRPKPQTSASVSASSATPPPPMVDAGPTPTNIAPPPMVDAGPTNVVTPPTASSTTTAPPPKPGKLTLERQAIDLVAVGQYTKAADIYDQLAAQNGPNANAYREAARILRTR